MHSRAATRKHILGSALFLCFTISGSAQVNVLTGNYDNSRSNSNLQETQLTPASVGPGTFGKLGSLPVDGQVFGQPLFVNSLSLPGKGVHDVVYIATEHNSVYAYDADTVAAPVLYWHVNLGASVPSDVVQSGYTDVTPEVGILSTGTIDLNTGVLYVVAETLQNGAPIFQLHALDLTTGSERMNGPVTITATFPGNGYGSDGTKVLFDPTMHIQRPGLLLSGGMVYIGFGSHADFGGWHGWVIAYNAGDLRSQTGVFNATPNGIGGSIWQSGRGLAADETGALYFVTGNGDFDAGGTGFGESMMKLSGVTLKPVDWYAAGNASWLSDGDYDLSAGVALIPGTHTAIAGDKYGDFYVVNGDAMGHQDANNTQQFNVGSGNFGLFAYAIWNRFDGPLVYAQQQWGPVQAFQVTGGTLNTAAVTASKTTTVTGYSGFAISANGGQPTSGILWQITRDTDSSPAGTLHAYNASDLTIELWNSNMASGDALGTFPKFVSPTVANGRVYVPTFSGAVVVYGLLGSSPAGGGSQAMIAAVESAASYASDAVSPGEIVTLFGMNLGPATAAGLQLDSSGNVATSLAATQVLFDGNPAPMIYAGSNQVSAVVPFGLTNPTTQVQVVYQGTASTAFPMNVTPATPAIFTADSSGGGQAAALNQDYSLNSDANPATAGSIVILYATGAGQMTPTQPDGSVTGYDSLPQPVLLVKVSIGGVPAQVLYAGAAPGMVAGVMQINVQIPVAVPSGDNLISLSVGQTTSPQSVTIAVQ